MRKLEALPAEVLLTIAESLDLLADISSFARVNRRLFNSLNDWLYRFDARCCEMMALEWAAAHGAINTAKKSIDAGFVNPCLLENLLAYLIIAAENSHTDIVSLILSQEGVNVNFVSEHRETPLSIASEEGHPEVVKLLLSTKGINVNLDSGGHTALICASRTDQLDVVQLLLDVPDIEPEHPDHAGHTPLYEAIDSKSLTVAKCFLERPGLHVDVNAMFTCHRRLSPKGRVSLLIKAAEKNLPEIVELLLAAPDIRVNHHDDDYRTALHEAAIVGCEKMVKDLLEHQAEPDPVDFYNETPLVLTAENGHLSVVKLLLDAGAEPNHVCNNGCTPLAAANENGHTEVVQVLLGTGQVFLSSLELFNPADYLYSRRVGRARRGPRRPRSHPIQYTSDGVAIGSWR